MKLKIYFWNDSSVSHFAVSYRVTVYIDQITSWFDVRTRQELVNITVFRKLQVFLFDCVKYWLKFFYENFSHGKKKFFIACFVSACSRGSRRGRSGPTVLLHDHSWAAGAATHTGWSTARTQLDCALSGPCQNHRNRSKCNWYCSTLTLELENIRFLIFHIKNHRNRSKCNWYCSILPLKLENIKFVIFHIKNHRNRSKCNWYCSTLTLELENIRFLIFLYKSRLVLRYSSADKILRSGHQQRREALAVHAGNLSKGD